MIFMQSYERRSKAIKKTSERQKKHCTADMMSDEEKVGDRHVCPPPNYRSERLNRFIQKLDEGLDSTPSSHARHTIVLGSPVEKRIPANAKFPEKDTDPPTNAPTTSACEQPVFCSTCPTSRSGYLEARLTALPHP